MEADRILRLSTLNSLAWQIDQLSEYAKTKFNNLSEMFNVYRIYNPAGGGVWWPEFEKLYNDTIPKDSCFFVYTSVGPVGLKMGYKASLKYGAIISMSYDANLGNFSIRSLMDGTWLDWKLIS